MSDIEQDEDYQVCDQCKETIYGEWVCYCWKCENDREKIIKSIGSIDHVWCVADVYDAAMALNNCCDEIGLIMDDMLSKPAPKLSIENYKAVTGCLFDLREACRRAKEGE